MTSTRLLPNGRRRWLTTGSFAVALAVVVGSQVHPSNAHADGTPAAFIGPSAAVVAAHAVAAPSPVAADEAPTAEAPAADTGTVRIAPAHTPAKAPKAPRKAAPHKAAASGDVCGGADWQAQRGERALATLRDNGQRSGVSVSFRSARAGYLGLTYPAQHHVDVFVRSCSAESWTLLRHVMSHEMGHAYDAAHMTEAMRVAYKQMRGIPASTPWFGCSYCTDFKTPAGDFAETYSQWQRGSHDSRTQMAPMPGSAELAAIAAAFFGA